MKKILSLLALLSSQIILSLPLFKSEPIVRVKIINSVDTLRISFYGNWLLNNGPQTKLTANDDEVKFFIDNDKIKLLKAGQIQNIESEHFILSCPEKNGTVEIKDVPYGVGWWWENKEDRIYEGELHLYKTKENKFEAVIHLPLEQYLKGVVPYEIGNDSPIEAMKAQAVAARSEAIMALNSKLYRGEHHDLTSDVECQVFSGNKKRTSSSDQAVTETKSLILTEEGKPINAYYASNCGGHSELIKNVWGDRPGVDSYIVSGFDSKDSAKIDLSDSNNLRQWLFSNPPSYCNPNIHNDLPMWSQNNFRWKVELTAETISRMVAKGKDLGTLLDIEILKRGESGRAYSAKYIFEKDSFEVKGELKIRQTISPPLRSSCFVVDKVDSGFVFYGAGWGHGVGMCQSGTITMAKNGSGFEEILKHYYRSAALTKAY
jgi:SpoIID/LytB domain protein